MLITVTIRYHRTVRVSEKDPDSTKVSDANDRS